MAGRAIICGGSIGGLFAASALARAGWEVDVFERTEVDLVGRGAGLVTHTELIAALAAVGAETKDLGVGLTERIAFDLAGKAVKTIKFEQLVTSWDRMYQVLRAAVPALRCHFGRRAVGYTDQGQTVEVQFADGGVECADLVVGADGFRSAIRDQMQPEVTPEYAGYVVWRTLAAEADFPGELHSRYFPAFGMFVPNGTQVVGYPIAGPENDLRPGHLRYNFVWYCRTSTEKLDDMLTDATGKRHDVSIPPPLVREDVLRDMETEAAACLPAPFVEILRLSERPFFTPIYDHHSPIMGKGRVALLGDAATVARPHLGMGVTKAAEDALSLARHLESGSVAQALAAYSSERVGAARLAHDRAKWLGSQIFDRQEGENRDGQGHPELEVVMRETAAVPHPSPDQTRSSA